MKEYFKLAGWLALCLALLAASFLFEGFDNFLRWPLIIGGAVYFFLSTIERYKREMREVIRDEVSKVMSAQFELNKDRHYETIRRLGQLQDKLDKLSGERL